MIAKDRYYSQPCLLIQQKHLEEGKAASITQIHNIASTTLSGNLKPHLFKMHNINIDCDSKQKEKTLLLNWCLPSEAKAAQSSYDINRDMVLWFCEDLNPFSMASDNGLNTFMRKNYNLNLPDGSMLSRAPLTDMFKTMRSIIIEEPKSVKSITLLFDGWTDKYRKMPFMGTRIATVNFEWDMQIYTLRCSSLIDHTAENIKNHIKGVIAEFFQTDSSH